MFGFQLSSRKLILFRLIFRNRHGWLGVHGLQELERCHACVTHGRVVCRRKRITARILRPKAARISHRAQEEVGETTLWGCFVIAGMAFATR